VKVGDVVNFQTKSWVFDSANDRYANPGIIIGIPKGSGSNRRVFMVYWRNGKVTREHSSYLDVVDPVKKAACK
jgi:hypothetical protein